MPASKDPVYTPHVILLTSKGLIARDAIDRCPEGTFLDMEGALERQENTISTRYGYKIINREPDTSTSPANYLFTYEPVAIASMRRLDGVTCRYVFLADGSVWFRAGTDQGEFTQIATAGTLSGTYPVQTVTITPFASGKPYLLIADSSKMLKDDGTGGLTNYGILPPEVPVAVYPYGPQHVVLLGCWAAEVNDMVGDSLTVGTETLVATVTYNETGTTWTTNFPNSTSTAYDHYLIADTTSAGTFLSAVPDGMLWLAADSTTSTNIRGVRYMSSSTAKCFNIKAESSSDTTDRYTTPIFGSTTYPDIEYYEVPFTVEESTEGTMTYTLSAAKDLSMYDSNDLIVLVIRVEYPDNISSISLQFDVGGGDFTDAYYERTITPVSYQGYISNPLSTDYTTALAEEVYLGVLLATGSSTTSSLSSLESSDLTSGEGSWSTIYMNKGSFLSIGTAGDPGKDWSQITAYRISITTNSNGATDVYFNSLYMQGGPKDLVFDGDQLSGPSSFSGVGYDYRYTYYNINTGTESNPSPSQYFSITPYNEGGVSTWLPMRQGMRVWGYYSTDKQVTHVRIYRRGGLFGNNWYYLDQFTNLISKIQKTWTYEDVLPDSVIVSANILELARDKPVSSTLETPINTTLSAALIPTADPITLNPNNPTLLTVTVDDSTAVFVQGQIVNIGTTTMNFEQTVVTTGGTGTFTAWIQLPHDAGETVAAFSTPAAPCNLCEQAYSQVWLGGDANNPQLLYRSSPSYPENVPPQDYIPSGTPNNPIMVVKNFKGTLFIGSLGDTWYQIFPGNPPRAQSTNSKHGPVSASTGDAENEIWYASVDGLRTFRGADGQFVSLPIDWIWQGANAITNQSPVAKAGLAYRNETRIAYVNNTAYISYMDADGVRHRLLYDSNYRRFRNDNLAPTAMCVETTTGTLLYTVPVTIDGTSGWALVTDVAGQDYDDGGWVTSGSTKVLSQSGIQLNLQTPFFDLKAPNNPKQFNVLTIDADPKGQTLTPTLILEDNSGTVASPTLSPASFTGTTRSKFQFSVNDGDGAEAYRVSLKLSGTVTSSPTIYQISMYAAILSDYRATYDTYWIKMGSDEFKMVKQGYFDYTTTAGTTLTVSLYTDGSTVAYQTFTLPANTSRSSVPLRVRFAARLMRQFRLVITVSSTSTSTINAFQLWSPVQIDWKPLIGMGAPGAKGYARLDLGDVTPNR